MAQCEGERSFLCRWTSSYSLNRLLYRKECLTVVGNITDVYVWDYIANYIAVEIVQIFVVERKILSQKAIFCYHINVTQCMNGLTILNITFM